MNVGLLIDFDHIVKPRNLTRLQNKVFPIPNGSNSSTNSTNSIIGLVLIIPKTHYLTLKQLKNGDDRVQYIDSPQFVDRICGHAYILYNKDK